MNGRCRVAILVLAGLVMASNGSAADAPSRNKQLDALVQPLIEGQIVPGLVVGTINGPTSQVVGYGKVSSNGPTPDERTLFEIGSVTKVFTALLLADMVQRQQVALEDPVQKWLPDTVHMPTYRDRPITLLDLATHTSELPRLPHNIFSTMKDALNPYADYTVEELYAFLSGYKLSHAPGKRYAYSNLGMGLLGHVLARRAGTTYEELVIERICRPLGMHETRITLSDQQRGRLAIGHVPGGESVPGWDIPTLAGAGALRSTAGDMLQLVSANLRPQQTPLADALEAAQLRRRDISSKMGIGLAWHISDDIGVHWHNGETAGYHSLVAFDRAHGIGVVILANAAAEQIDELGLKVLQLLAGKPVEPFKIPKSISLDPAILDRYVGNYSLTSAFEITVFRQGKRLMAQVAGQPALVLLPQSETEFFYPAVEARISFVRNSDGRFNQLILHQHGLDLPAWRNGLFGQLNSRFWKALTPTAKPPAQGFGLPAERPK